MSQAQLGAASGVAASMISRLEHDDRRPGIDVMSALAASLQVDSRIFSEPVVHEARIDEVHFRHRARTPVGPRNIALGHATLLGELIDFFDANLRLPQVRLPTVQSDLSTEAIECAAELMRRGLGIPNDCPLASLVGTLESAGVLVVLAHSGHRDVDAFSLHRSLRPLIMLNRKDSGSRVNFTGAHELGHLVLHRGIETGDGETERQADRFASAFLMPAKAFAAEFPRPLGSRLDWPALTGLKQRWRVSIQAMVRRAFDLGLIAANTYRIASQYASSRGWRRADPGEPAEFSPDEPRLLRDCFGAASQLRDWTPAKIASRLAWNVDLLRTVSCIDDLSLEDAHPHNVLLLAKRR
jgi:Zn-dependent peptidase ImmA (M78 family)/transcriptional regulator with XRE-family HTH domain